MKNKSLGNPFSPDSDLRHGAGCTCHHCETPKAVAVKHENQSNKTEMPVTTDDIIDRAVESAIVRGMFAQNEQSRRQFMKLVGGRIGGVNPGKYVAHGFD